jgi:hypothetical protein
MLAPPTAAAAFASGSSSISAAVIL